MQTSFNYGPSRRVIIDGVRERDCVSEPDEPLGHPGQGNHHRSPHALAMVRDI